MDNTSPPSAPFDGAPGSGAPDSVKAMVSGGGQAQPPSSAPAAEYGSRLPQMVDREGSYKLHGEIMLLLFVAVFAFLFTCVFFFLWLRRRDRRR
ncbi:hypothetical protein ZWY2020_014063 [Hordeum vulgare]|nr:hypothetical protein ZWY2020_014063 [Hordeum vulgare]